MTRLALLADIHGNLPALEAVLADIEVLSGVDQVVIAGDVVNWGPFSAQVMARVMGHDWAIIRGNNEYYLLDYNTPYQPDHWREYTLLPWLHEQLVGHWHRVIASWPDEITLRFPDAPPIRWFMGNRGTPWRSLHPLMSDDEILAAIKGVDTPTLIAAHSHLALDRQVGGVHLINPGSVGVPIDGLFTASYALLDGDADGWSVTFRRLTFDLEAVLREFKRTGFAERFGIEAQLVIEEFRTARLQMHPFHAWRKVIHPGTPMSDEMLAKFHQIDKWPFTPPEYHLNQ